MKRPILYSLAAVLLAFALPVLLYVPGSADPAPAAPAPSPVQTPEASPVPTAPPEPVLDAGIRLRVLTDGGVETMTMAEYLPLALAGEMPAAFAPDALKAQAVTLRSYALYYQAQPKDAHPEADVCCSAACCAARADPEELRERWGEQYDAYYARICAAVEETDGQYLVWEEEPALTVFHASSAGQTESGAALGMPRHYLVSVDPPETEETVQDLCTDVEVTQEEFRRAVLSLAPEAALDGGAETWLGSVSQDTAGRVTAMEIGGASLSGLALRQLFSLRSTAFTLERTEAGFVFHVRGYGHGLGMSQQGANLMAKDGADYAAILRHYYPGTELVMALRSAG